MKNHLDYGFMSFQKVMKPGFERMAVNNQ